MSTTHGVDLLSNASATGPSGGVLWPGGKGYFAAKATWGGGNVALQFLGPDGATWIAYTSGSLSADGGLIFELPPCRIRAAVTTATAVYAHAARIPA